MHDRDKVFQLLREKNVRLTKPRRAIIEILGDNHLTLQEIYDALLTKGFHNLGTVYNTIDFLLEHKIITQVFINGKKHYDLTIDEDTHTADSHVHVMCKMDNNIVEINQSELFDMIKSHPAFSHFDIEKLQIVAEGVCKYQNTVYCKKDDTCYLRRISQEAL